MKKRYYPVHQPESKLLENRLEECIVFTDYLLVPEDIYLETFGELPYEYVVSPAILRRAPKKKDTDFPEILSDFDNVEIGKTYDEIMSRYGEETLDFSAKGYYTSFGRFVTQEEASKISKECFQYE